MVVARKRIRNKPGNQAVVKPVPNKPIPVNVTHSPVNDYNETSTKTLQSSVIPIGITSHHEANILPHTSTIHARVDGKLNEMNDGTLVSTVNSDHKVNENDDDSRSSASCNIKYELNRGNLVQLQVHRIEGAEDVDKGELSHQLSSNNGVKGNTVTFVSSSETNASTATILPQHVNSEGEHTSKHNLTCSPRVPVPTMSSLSSAHDKCIDINNSTTARSIFNSNDIQTSCNKSFVEETACDSSMNISSHCTCDETDDQLNVHNDKCSSGTEEVFKSNHHTHNRVEDVVDNLQRSNECRVKVIQVQIEAKCMCTGVKCNDERSEMVYDEIDASNECNIERVHSMNNSIIEDVKGQQQQQSQEEMQVNNVTLLPMKRNDGQNISTLNQYTTISTVNINEDKGQLKSVSSIIVDEASQRASDQPTQQSTESPLPTELAAVTAISPESQANVSSTVTTRTTMKSDLTVAGGVASSSVSLAPAMPPRSALVATKSVKEARKEKERKTAKTLAIITGVFIFCWLPFFVMTFITSIYTGQIHVPQAIFSFFQWLGYLNSLLNPVIYTIFSPDFRNAFKKMLIYKRPSFNSGRSKYLRSTRSVVSNKLHASSNRNTRDRTLQGESVNREGKLLTQVKSSTVHVNEKQCANDNNNLGTTDMCPSVSYTVSAGESKTLIDTGVCDRGGDGDDDDSTQSDPSQTPSSSMSAYL